MSNENLKNTKKCPICGETIKAQAKKCRHCGEWLNKVKEEQEIENSNQCGIKIQVSREDNGNLAKAFLGIVAILIILFKVFNFISTNDGIGSNLEVTESHVCSMGYGLTAICGTVVNKSNRNRGYIQVDINMYDGNGNIIGNTNDGIDNLEGNSTWKFSAPIVETNVDHYKIKKVSGL